ncbi:CCR4-NOT transcription complex subunit 6-like [Balamuthia mandrillaris]
MRATNRSHESPQAVRQRSRHVQERQRPPLFSKNTVHIDALSVLSYNVLAVRYARKGWLPHASRKVLDPNYRRHNLLREILDAHADILCLQEVDEFEKEWREPLEQAGYECQYKHRTGGRKDGCLIAYLARKFRLVERRGVNFNTIGKKAKRRSFLTQNVALMVELQQLCNNHEKEARNEEEREGEGEESGTSLVVACVHLNWEWEDLKLLQTLKLMEELTSFRGKYIHQKKENREPLLPLLLCGDFNAMPPSCCGRTNKHENETHNETEHKSKNENGKRNTEEGDEHEKQEKEEEEHTQKEKEKGTEKEEKEEKEEKNNGTDKANQMETEIDGEVYQMLTTGVIDLSGLAPKLRQRLRLPLHVTLAQHKGHKGESNEEPTKSRTNTKTKQQKRKLPSVASAYKEVLGMEPPFTNRKPNFRGTLDYIFYSRDSEEAGEGEQEGTLLVPTAVLDVPSEKLVLELGALPNRVWSSDHLMLWASFLVLQRCGHTDTKQAITNKLNNSSE